jgi:hypothetical protein
VTERGGKERKRMVPEVPGAWLIKKTIFTSFAKKLASSGYRRSHHSNDAVSVAWDEQCSTRTRSRKQLTDALRFGRVSTLPAKCRTFRKIDNVTPPTRPTTEPKLIFYRTDKLSCRMPSVVMVLRPDRSGVEPGENFVHYLLRSYRKSRL